MKEATGELNATVLAVVAVGILLAFFYFTLWPVIRNNTEHNTNCSKAICDKCPNGDGKTVSCYYCDKGTPKEITCSWHNVPADTGDCHVNRVCTYTK